MLLNKKTVILAVSLVLFGCGKERLVIDGQRVPVLGSQEVVASDYMKGDIKISLPTPNNTTLWNQSGGNSSHNLEHISSNAELKELWTADFGKGNSKRDYLIASPLIAENMVFAIDADATVSAFSKETGKKIWKTRLKPKVRYHRFWRNFGLRCSKWQNFMETL